MSVTRARPAPGRSAPRPARTGAIPLSALPPAAALRAAVHPGAVRSWGRVVPAARMVFVGTPGRLRLNGMAAILACIAFGVLSFVAASVRANALQDARSDAEQLVRVQTIRTSLVSADANLTNAFLVGGLEPTSERSAYEQGIADASSAIEAASAQQNRDAGPLAGVNRVLTQYTGLVESARANNRQGFPIGAAYLRSATSLLRDDALPILQRLSTVEQDRVNAAYRDSGAATRWAQIGLGVAIVMLAAIQFWLFRRTHRVINVWLFSMSAVVLVVGLVLLTVLGASQGRADDVRSTAYRYAAALTTARSAAFDAKSAESLTLINRGSGQAYEARFATLAALAGAQLDIAAADGPAERAAQRDFARYLAVHRRVRAADDSGRWEDAVTLATSTDQSLDGANPTFAAFDRDSAAALSARSAEVGDELHGARSSLRPWAWSALAIGLAAAAGAWCGVAIRLREYR